MAEAKILLSNDFGTFRKTGEIYDIVFERPLNHSVADVWEAITDPAKLRHWLGESTVDLKINGAINIDFQGMQVVGQILQLKEQRLLEYTWTSQSFAGEISIVSWELFPGADNACRLQFSEKLVSPKYLTGAGPGWHYVLDTLSLVLEGKPVPVWNDNAWQQVAAQATEKYKAILAGQEESSQQPPLPLAKASMLIRKPPIEIYEAFVDPAITTQYWFSRSSGRLELGKPTTWYWDDYQVSAEINAHTLLPGKHIHFTWPAQGGIESTVKITFSPRGANAAFVTVEESGWHSNTEGINEILVGQTEGWSLVLAGLKAWLEHGIRLQLVSDHNPEALRE